MKVGNLKDFVIFDEPHKPVTATIQAQILSGPMKGYHFEISVERCFTFSLKEFCATEFFLGHMLANDFLVSLDPKSWGILQDVYFPDQCELRFDDEALVIPICYANKISDKVLKLSQKENT